jgi:uncharacterized protein (UPF0210 family)
VKDRTVLRTITLGLAGPHPLSEDRVEQAAMLLRDAAAACAAAGFDVQTLRISTGGALDDLSDPHLVRYAERLQWVLDDVAIDHFSLGAVPAADPSVPIDRLPVLEDVLAGNPALSCAVQLATVERGIRVEAALPVARVMRGLADRTDGGVGNFRFAALACVGPGHPFFPAAHHAGPDTITVGLQSADVVSAALAGVQPLDLPAITGRVRDAVTAQAKPVVDVIDAFARETGLEFGGIDLSPAPSIEAGIAAAVQAGLGGPIGSAGTIAVVGAITTALRTTGLPTCGYNGLMLPVLEDVDLASQWEAGRLVAHQLLAYSAICGTGLDTVPLPGDASETEIAGLLLDTATLATRLVKPLSARLFPVPGLRAGDRTAFGSPHLTDITLPGD